VRAVRVVCVTIDEDLLEQLETFAIRNKMSRSEAIRRAIKLLLTTKEVGQ